MTDQFYYNCLVPNASVLENENKVSDDAPPPRPPRPQRPFDANAPTSPDRRNDSATRSMYSKGPEIPPKMFGTNVPPIHKRQRSEPLSETQSWAPQPQYYEDPFSDSEKSPPVKPPWILDSANKNNAFIENNWGQGNIGSDASHFDFNQSRESRDSSNSTSSVTSPIWQDSERIQGHVLRGSDRSSNHTKRNSVSEVDRSQYYNKRNHSTNDLIDRMPSYSKRNSVSEIERMSKGFMVDKSPVHDIGNSNTGYDKQSPVLSKRSPGFESKQSPLLSKRSPGFDRNSQTGSVDSVTGHIPYQKSPGYDKNSQIPVSMEPNPDLQSARRRTIDNSTSSYESSPATSRAHEYHQTQVPRQSSTESVENVSGATDRNNGGVLRPSYSFKDNSTRAQSVYGGASTQPVPVTNIQSEIQPLQSASAQLQRRSLPTPSRAIVEEERIEADNVSRLDLGQSNMTDAYSHSIESLDEVDSVLEVRYDDVELGSLDTEEPETWSETVDKKVLKKLNPKDIKRQDTIWELIQTERHFCKRLKTLQIFFRDGMLNELRMPIQYVDRMFPQLDDLISIHMSFLRQLQGLQSKRQDRLVEEIGPTLKEQFTGDSSNQMKSAYGAFCSGHLEAVQLYKDLLAREKKFQHFIKQKSTHHLCRRREVPDFILLITQRPTKYPTLIEAVIKSTKDKRDRECLLKALELSKDVLQAVDRQVAAAERAMKLKDICNRLDSRAVASHRGKKLKKSDIQGRRLLHEGVVGWKNARGKSVEVLAVVLHDVLLFLQENNQKYTFFAQDNKGSVVSLFNLLVREKRDTRDTIGIYLISQNKQCPEMYEVVFNTTSEMQKWAKILRSAVEQCPEEVEEEVQTAADEERVRQERRAERAQKIQEQLHEKDKMIRECCEAKNKLLAELHAIYNEADDQPRSRPSSRDFEEISSPAENAVVLQAAIQEVSMAASQLTNMLQDGNGTNLSRSVSSVGEHSSNTYTALPIPKRAETFAGFDSHDVNRLKLKSSDAPDMSDGSNVGREPDGSDLDTSQYSDISTGPGVQQNYDSESESGRGSIQSSTSSMTVTQMSKLTQDQSNIAHLVATLNNIVHLTASQGTAVETLRAQLAEANERINKLSADVHDNKHKPGYRHNQLEELRNLQGVIQKEKEEWELKKTKENRDMEQDKAQLDEMKRNLDKQENDLKQQKEEFNKKREVLQRQMDLLRQSGQLPKDTSLSDLESAEQSTDGAELNSGFVPGHRRSASAESFNSNMGDDKKNVPNTSKENNFRSDAKSMTKLQSFSFGSSKQSLPVHLLSATNEQKIGSKNVQQLPSKLLGNVSSSSQQVTQTGPKNNTGNISQSAGNQSLPTLTPEHGSNGDSNLGHSASTGHIANHGNNPVGSSVTVPMGSRQSNRPKTASMVASLSGVLKLAEKGDKKGKSSSSSSHSGDKGARSSPPQNEKSSQQRPKSGQPANRNPNINHKAQKSDSDVIYF